MLSRDILENIVAVIKPSTSDTVGRLMQDMARALLALQWRPITETDLPTMQDEVGGWRSDGRFHAGIVGAMGAADVWVERGWTHFRPVAPPTDKGEEKP